MMRDHDWVATFRVQYRALDDVEAMLVADQMVQDLSTDLVATDGEEAVLTQLVDVDIGITPEELLVQFRATRNALIRTRMQHCVNVAKEVDQIIMALEHNDLHLYMPYDHGRFMDLLARVVKGENPQ